MSAMLRVRAQPSGVPYCVDRRLLFEGRLEPQYRESREFKILDCSSPYLRMHLSQSEIPQFIKISSLFFAKKTRFCNYFCLIRICDDSKYFRVQDLS